MQQLDLDAPEITPPEMSKSSFARYSKLSDGRISQLIKEGMPTLPNGRILVADAEAWIAANVSRRSEAIQSDAHHLATVKIEREEANRDLLRLKVDEQERRLIDRRAVEIALFDRARGERDAHMAWVSRVAPLVAAELEVDLSRLYAVLDREMRNHLAELAETPLEDLGNVG